MPSRPMLTTPARSAKSPPRAASPIGTARTRVVAKTADAVRPFSPEITRTIGDDDAAGR